MVHDLDVVAVFERRQRPVETVFAEVAPGTDQVGPDLDAHGVLLRVGIRR
jgi:hypothetical protein